ncbi:MAG: hypothetical protein HQL18_04995 [Candidatus Omnitrophica bacterium]|nr:hypothetical protein [Candidatus Omnitrophota bacterium]
MRLSLTATVVLMVLLCSGSVFAQDAFIEVKGNHFVMQYTVPDEKAVAEEILSKAEDCYERITRDIGFTKYADFWTWDKRVKIILFPDQISYARFTGQPKWSKGYASRDSRLFRDRVVVTYDGQSEIFSAILPHEIAHLVFWDLLAQRYAATPEWFEEGIAQLEEQDKREMVREAMRPVAQAGKHIPFNVLRNLKPSEMQDETQVSLFYAQSLSMVTFLIEKYGQDAFYRLSKELRDGRDFESALMSVYGGIFSSMSGMESRWVKYASGEGG